MPTPPLMSPIRLGDLDLPNRCVMAPMTRTRARVDRVPTAMMAEYYAQRASAGLIVTECTAITPDSAGIIRAPGLYSDEQVAGWRLVTDAVHAAGGRIFCQLWHGGRCSHVSLQPGASAPVAPSPIAAEGLIFTLEGRVAYSLPRAIEIREIDALVAAFAAATRRACSAGFDGVKLHAAFGYLPDQFLQDGSNHRTNGYGGPIANRARFLFEVVDAMIDAWDARRVGVKISPANTSYGISDSDPLATFGPAIRGLSARGIGYLHLMEPDQADFDKGLFAAPEVINTFGTMFEGPIIGNCRFDRGRANAAIAAGKGGDGVVRHAVRRQPRSAGAVRAGRGHEPARLRDFLWRGAQGLYRLSHAFLTNGAIKSA